MTEQITHTPGPWRLQPIHLRGSTAYNIAPDIARIPSGLQSQAETDANARLIVAAPAMAALLVRWSKQGLLPELAQETRDILRAAGVLP